MYHTPCIMHRPLPTQLSIPPSLLVLHGASGLPLPDIRKSRQLGVVKFNVNTDLRMASMQYYSEVWGGSGGGGRRELLDVMLGVTAVMENLAEDKIDAFRS
ncbi:hypothetical protein EON63_12620 [archaeon]|nr:MAG: hypothetical protein EON63_12620 [archaeon]